MGHFVNAVCMHGASTWLYPINAFAEQRTADDDDDFAVDTNDGDDPES